MYLISIYFDEESDKRIREFMKQIAKYTGNAAMLDGNIPPHLTISAFQAASEEQAKNIFEKIIKKVTAGEVHWVSVGAFFPSVIYLAPVLNEYLQQLADEVYDEMILEGVTVSNQYQPYSWLPHTTLGKTLNKEEMQKAFAVMQNQFGPFRSNVIKLGLARTNPHTDLDVFTLES